MFLVWSRIFYCRVSAYIQNSLHMMRYAPLKKEAEKSAGLPAAGGSVVDIVCTSQHPASLPFLNPQVGQPFQHKLVGFGQCGCGIICQPNLPGFTRKA